MTRRDHTRTLTNLQKLVLEADLIAKHADCGSCRRLAEMVQILAREVDKVRQHATSKQYEDLEGPPF